MSRSATEAPSYQLAPPPARAVVPTLDPHQQRVIDHESGPLLVLAGPGTGKTTTLVEAIADRIEGRGAAPESVLALTFSRKAAEQLRDRVTARLGSTLSATMSSTFHSFAYGLIRQHSKAELYAAPLRLLSAPEQDVVLTDLLSESPESVVWPESLRRASQTRGFAQEVAAVLARAREKGLDGLALHELGKQNDLPEFVAAGWFLEQYLGILDSQSATDYPDLIRRAVIDAGRHRDELRARYTHVFVDEYQDTDPGQVALLRELAGDGRNLIVVGDPHQSIYGFRGAEVRGILDFPRMFPRADGRPADVAVLRATRRFGPAILGAAQNVAARLPLHGSIDVDTRAAFLDPVALDGVPPGRVEVFTYDTDRAEVERLADLLRRAHLEDDVAWSDMAVLVRSGRATIPALRRALGAAGVPVEVASDETPLVREPAVAPLLDALRAVVNLDNDDPTHADYLDPSRAEGLLVSPLVGLDATDVRALARLLRARDRVTATAEGRSPSPSPELLRTALLHPGLLHGADLAAARRVVNFGSLLASARALLDSGGTAEEVLWHLWAGTSWPEALRRGVERGGSAARLSHRDLDAVCALFENAARNEEQRGHTSVASFLATLVAQQIPADTLAERGIRGDAVRLLTAHRSKGLEWRLVVVAHVQEGAWPDLRRRSTLLRADRIGALEYASPVIVPDVSTRALLAEERRLFYVACTRARDRLVVTAVASPDDDGDQASRFLTELGVEPVHKSGRPPRPMSLSGLVAELRRTAADPAAPPLLRAAAVRRLAGLAQQRLGNRPVVPAADPATWWGTRGRSRSETPVRPTDRAIALSASAVTALEECPAKWFLEREAGGVSESSQSQGFGNLAHALADQVVDGELSVTEPDLDTLMEHVDAVWAQLQFRTPWSGEREREQMRKALGRFLDWHRRDDAREVLATEHPLHAELTLPDGQEVVLRGRADRLEIDAEGRVVVIDLKTGKYPPTDTSLPENAQLGFYQLAVEHGAAAGLVEDAQAGGAELWHLRIDKAGRPKVQHQPPQEPDDDGARAIEKQLMRAATAIRLEEFPARPGTHCDRCAFEPLCPARNAGTVLQ